MLIFLLCFFSIIANAPAQNLPLAPRFVIDLDADPKTRWNEVFSPQMLANLAPIKAWLNGIISPAIQKLLAPVVADLDQFFPAEYADELRGMAELTKPAGFDLGILVGMNLIYDVSAACTSIVAQTAHGEMLHARNLDYPIPGLSNITIQLDFRKGGVTQYTATTFAGYIGVLTGQRPSRWSVSVNEREGPGNQLENIIIMLMQGGASIGMFLRTALHTQPDWSSAMTHLQHTDLIAPVYLTVAGASAGEGAVITRNRKSVADVWTVLAPKQWYVLETNDDRWLAPTDNRRAAATAHMNTFSMDNISLANLLSVLSTAPVFAPSAKYTALISNQQNSYVTYLRHVED